MLTFASKNERKLCVEEFLIITHSILVLGNDIREFFKFKCVSDVLDSFSIELIIISFNSSS